MILGQVIRSNGKAIPAMQKPGEKVRRRVKLKKDKDIGFGLTITCGDTYETVLYGAFVENVIPNGPADVEGTLSSGDHILSVNGEDVTFFHYFDVVDIIQNLEEDLELVVAKTLVHNDYKDYKEVDEEKCIKMKTWMTSKNNLNTEPEVKKNQHYTPELKESLQYLCFLSNQPPFPKPRKKWAERSSSTLQSNGHPLPNGKAEVIEDSEHKGLSVDMCNYINSHSKVVDASVGQLHNRLENDTGSLISSQEPMEQNMNYPDYTVTCDNLYEQLSSRIASNEGRKITKREETNSKRDYINDDNYETEMQANKCHGLSPGEVFHVVLEKSHGTLGLNLCQGKNKLNMDQKQVYIHSIVPGGAASKDGRILPGDRLVEVNGITLEGLPYSEVISLIRKSPTVAHLVLESGDRKESKFANTEKCRNTSNSDEQENGSYFTSDALSYDLYNKNLDQKNFKTDDDGSHSFSQSHSDYTSSSSVSLPQACFSSGNSSPGSPSYLSNSSLCKDKDLPANECPNFGINSLADELSLARCAPEFNTDSCDPSFTLNEVTSNNECSLERKKCISPLSVPHFNFNTEVHHNAVESSYSKDCINDESDSCISRNKTASIDHMNQQLYTQAKSFLDKDTHISSSECSDLPYKYHDVAKEQCTSPEKHSPSVSEKLLSVDLKDRINIALPTSNVTQKAENEQSCNVSSDSEQRINESQIHHISAVNPSRFSDIVDMEENKETNVTDLFDNSSMKFLPKNFETEVDEKSHNSYSYSEASGNILSNCTPGLFDKSCTITGSEMENSDAPKVPQRRAKKLKRAEDIYRFINSDNTFNIIIRKSSRGLGLSIYGGKDATQFDPLHHLIRIRKLYPLQPAIESGELQIGDVILEVNGKKTIGLTNTEALEMLRGAPSDVILKVYRPDTNIIPPLSAYLKDDSRPSSFLIESSHVSNEVNGPENVTLPGNMESGEFDITVMKREGSLGFTVSKKEESHIGPPAGIYIKELIREPAISDGRIQPGDRILQVNGIEVSSMTHAEAIKFLRSAPETVTLKLFRCDPPLSPGTIEDEPCLSKPLRKEAIELLSDRMRSKDKNSSSPKKLGQRRIKNKLANDSQSSSSSESNSSSGAEAILNSSCLENNTSEDDINSEGPTLQRNQRPRSLDVLNASDRKQRLSILGSNAEDIYAFHRQASVMGIPTEPPCNKSLITVMSDSKEGKGGKVLLKWRGATLEDKEDDSTDGKTIDVEISTLQSPDIKSSITSPLSSAVENQREEHDLKENKNADSKIASLIQVPWVRIVHVELDRGWHGRLGFSLGDYQLNETDPVALPHAPVVKIVHPHSLAARDGRIKVGDRIIQVNSEAMEDKPAAEVIDFLRKTKGILKMMFARLEMNEKEEETTLP